MVNNKGSTFFTRNRTFTKFCFMTLVTCCVFMLLFIFYNTSNDQKPCPIPIERSQICPEKTVCPVMEECEPCPEKTKDCPGRVLANKVIGSKGKGKYQPKIRVDYAEDHISLRKILSTKSFFAGECWLADTLILDYLLEKYQYICNFLELGTSSGKTAALIAFVLQRRGHDLKRECQAWSYNIRDTLHPWNRENVGGNLNYILGDVQSNGINWEVVEHVQKSDLILVDNGAKTKEFKLYHRFARKGTILIIDDFPIEVTTKQLEEFVEDGTVEWVNIDFMEGIFTKYRVVKKLTEADQIPDNI